MKRSILTIALAVIVTSIITTGCSSKKQPSVKCVELNNWSFSHNNDWLAAEVPGCIHLDLMNHNIIDDPFFGTNESKVKWVAETDWNYKTSFKKDIVNGYNNVALVFDGVDTYSDILLNEKHLGKTDNMFLKWSYPIDVNNLSDENILNVNFTNSRSVENKKAAELEYTLPELFAFSRKAHYHDGWDWGPELSTMGLWQPVYFKLWNEFFIEDVYVQQNTITENNANIDINVEIVADGNVTVDVDYIINGKNISTVKNVNLADGINYISFNYDIVNPELWWPNGMGEQNMYDVAVRVESSDYFDEKSERTGLRTIRLSREKDAIGSEYTFIVNGIPTFAKGANYIPPESFMTRMTDERYKELIQDCKSANMNMLRMWGGGQYENEAFYDYCDEMGIMVFQDFMFCCAIYPGDENILNSIKEEAEYQVKRLRNHPSMALWCGNNEVKNGWEDWGWQDAYTPQQRKKIASDYDKIFKEILPNAVDSLDHGCDYAHTSPEWGWGHPECVTDGDSHYWGVWWGEQPFEVWSEKTGRFMSEYGFQGHPQLSTWETVTDESERYLGSPSMDNHQKHARGSHIIHDMMKRYFGAPEKLEDYIYVSQLLQAYGIGSAIEVHRMKMPHCMGTLYWQLNDCWPVVSWSSVDYYGNWKALHYRAKELFEPLIIATEMQNDSLYIYLVSDHLNDIKGDINVDIMTFDSKVLNNSKISNRVAKANTSSNVVIFPVVKEFLDKKDEVFFNISFTSKDDNLLANKIFYLEYPKSLSLPKADVDYEVTKSGDKYLINIKANTFASQLYVYTDEYAKGRFSDNFIDMKAGDERVIEFIPLKKNVDNINFKIKTYN